MTMPAWITRRCVECGHEVKQMAQDTAATFCTCEPTGPEMVPPPYPGEEVTE